MYITDVNCTKLTLNWEAPVSDGGSIINKYCIRQRQGEDDWQYLHEVLPSRVSKQSKSIVEKLTPLKEYYFGISAKNKIGTGDYKDTELPIVLLRYRGRLSGNIILLSIVTETSLTKYKLAFLKRIHWKGPLHTWS